MIKIFKIDFYLLNIIKEYNIFLVDKKKFNQLLLSPDY
jgi:hypothetical protein